MKIMSVDLGLARTGIAACDPMEMLASPVTVIFEKNEQRLIEKIVEQAKSIGAEMIVVGHPKNMDGSCGERANECARIAAVIGDESGLETVLWDERCTTVSAANALNVTNTRGKKRKAVIDAVAAVMILQSYIDSRSRHNRTH